MTDITCSIHEWLVMRFSKRILSRSSLIDQDLASKLKAEVRDGPIVRKVNYVDRQVEVKSD